MDAIRLRRTLALTVVPLLLLAACGSDDEGDDDAAPTTTSTTEAAPAEPLEILVTNDDGYAAPGIDAVVEALRKEKDVHLTVVAPAENQSGSGDATTPGEHAVAKVKLMSGYEATSVAGKPADSVNHALDVMKLEPDLVVSGTNTGQNIGPFSTVSGTVGAAKTAARRGIPAIAASTGIGDDPEYAESAQTVIDWFREHRDAIADGSAEATVTMLNTPTCPDRTSKVVEVPLATDFKGRDAGKVDCASTKPESELTDDVDAFLNGYTSLSVLTV